MERGVIGIDVGGTKTHLRWVGNGAARDQVVPSAQWRRRNWEADAGSLAGMARDLAGADGFAALAVGSHGCDDAAECNAFQAALARRLEVPVRVVNDAELLPAALGLVGAIGLVAGTGAIAVWRDREGRMFTAGGWGWIIGDEGSAAGLVREAARAVSRHLDAGGSAADPLVGLLFEALGVGATTRLGGAIARAGGAAGLGRHAPAVFEAADAGSALAARVIDEGGRELAALVERLLQNGAEATKVVAGGAVIASQSRLSDAFLSAVGALGGIEAVIHRGPPVSGACVMAAGLAGSRTRAAWIHPTSTRDLP
jgi:N-acetylglucosamine kinase-like BadF-type ATPase